jgi:hypothetical protein
MDHQLDRQDRDYGDRRSDFQDRDSRVSDDSDDYETEESPEGVKDYVTFKQLLATCREVMGDEIPAVDEDIGTACHPDIGT